MLIQRHATKTARVFKPLLEPARYKGAHGGRGSGKSQFFAGLAVEDALRFPSEAGEGLRFVGIREVQRTLQHSAKSLIASKIVEMGFGERDGFKVYADVIKTPGDGVMIFQGMQDHTADSIKSLEGFHRAWVEEAQSISPISMQLLRPTIRWEDTKRGLASELHFSWNPRRRTDPVDMMLRGPEKPQGAVVVEANWSDNPWFPAVLDAERLDCLRMTPDQYDHIWGGGYASVNAGAYYATHIAKAKEEGRIGRVVADPLMTIFAVWDIGGTGAKADACAIWIGQFIGAEIRWLDYYEAQGQPLAVHVNWLRANGYKDALCILPHDGAANDKVHAVSYESALRDAEFDVRVIPNQGAGAASLRVESARRHFGAMLFDTKCQPGLDAIGWYHERRDPNRGIGLGPEHDWSSHGADAFGLGAIAFETRPKNPVHVPVAPVRSGKGWMT